MKKTIVNLVLVVVVVSLAMCSTVGAEAAEGSDANVSSTAVKAYELRMAGKIEDAQKLLEKALAKNPKDAAGYYELARIQLHMALGGGRSTINMIGESQKSIERAVGFDPKNVMYASFAGNVNSLQAYSVAMRGSLPKEELAMAIGAYESALKSKPDHHQAALYLVELYSQFPEEAGGDKKMAEKYAKQLEAMNEVYGAKARSILLPEDVDRIDYWEKVLKKHKDNADVIEELGKAYLRADKKDRAVSYFEKAIKIDPERAYLFLDLSIYHTFRAMMARNDRELFQRSVTSGDAAVVRYIKSKPIDPMLAYALGVRSKYKSHSGEKEQGQILFKQAKAMDPYFSKATGAPHPDLFIRPGKVSGTHRYLMRRF